MKDSTSTLCEIYVLKSERWQIYANYSPEDRQKCVSEAKELFASGRFEAVRVVEETFDTATNTAQEKSLYCSPRRPPRPKHSAVEPLNAPSVPLDATTTVEPVVSILAKGKPKYAVIGTVSLAVSGFISYVVVLALQQMQVFKVGMSSFAATIVLLAIFLVSTISIFTTLMRRYGRYPRQLSTAKQATPVPTPNPTAAVLDEHAATTKLPEARSLPEENLVLAEIAEEATIPADAREFSNALLKFIHASLESLSMTGRPLDAFNRFGLTLYISGAVEYLATRDGLSREAVQNTLSAHLRMLGHTQETARNFAANIDEYLVNPKYFRMYEEGRNSIAQQNDEPDAAPHIIGALDYWNEPAATAKTHDKEFVAVLFTDIVGSTAMTQERGDDAAQFVVHQHNMIVRDALALHGGKEIKHTGDGIMGTFPMIANAIVAAIAIQQACQRANVANPDLGLGICIGINAGEPIHEGGDIFGTPVQMAARVLSVAEGDEIAVSNIVREMCVGKSYEFLKKGDFDLKGFPESVPIYLVNWMTNTAAPEASG